MTGIIMVFGGTKEGPEGKQAVEGWLDNLVI